MDEKKHERAPQRGKNGRGSIPWPWWDHLLGTMSDGALAEKIGCSAAAVRVRRHKLGVPPCRKHRPGARTKAPHNKDRRTSPLYEASELGVMTDPEVAALYGCSKQRVHQVRKRLGIPAASSTESD